MFSPQKGQFLQIREGGKMGEASFRKGAVVEVSLDEDGFHGSFYTAKVVKILKAEKRLVVEFEALVSDEDDKKPLQEKVDYGRARPCPLETVRQKGIVFNVNQKVDAFYNDGWWVGTVRKTLAHNRYRVYFSGYDEEMILSATQLRAHQEWLNGQWVSNSSGDDRKDHRLRPCSQSHNDSEIVPEEVLRKELSLIDSNEDKSSHADNSDEDNIEMYVVSKRVIDLVSSDDDT